MKNSKTLWMFITTLVVCGFYLLGTTLIFKETSPDAYLRFIAGGIFGKIAIEGDSSYVIKGIGLHLLIGLIWVGSFFGMYPNFRFRYPNWIKTGLVFGTIVSFVMNFGVIPIAITKDFPVDPVFLVKSLLLTIITVGFPIAIIYIKLLYKIPEEFRVQNTQEVG